MLLGASQLVQEAAASIAATAATTSTAVTTWATEVRAAMAALKTYQESRGSQCAVYTLIFCYGQ